MPVRTNEGEMIKNLVAFSVLFQVVGCYAQVHAKVSRAAGPIHVPLTADHWHVLTPSPGGPKPDLGFARHEGFPEGVLVLKSGAALLDGLTFQDGTIQFDIKAIGEDIPGVQFRVDGPRFAENGEEFYVRTSPDCRASNDCIQYTPVINGFMLWNSYPQYQTQAFILDGWNHIKLVVSGHRMNVYINRLPQPALTVGSLESTSGEGHIELRGPAYYANLTVTPDAVEGLSPTPTADPTAADQGMVRHWQLGALRPFVSPAGPTYVDIPKTASRWKSITAERFGMVNLNRDFTLRFEPPPLTWLRTIVVSNSEQKKHVSLGWLGRVWVFVNGKLVTQGENLYDIEGERRDPDGRMSLENGSFDLPLQRGPNEVVVALVSSIHEDKTPNRYGWGLEMRFDDIKGITLTK